MMAGTTRDGPVAGRLEGGSPPNRFLVALAVLTVLADAAEEQPLLLIIDDAQWLDRESAKVLAFLARRLYADAIACLFAVREPAEQKVPLDGLANLYVRCLQEAGSRELLLSLTGVPLDERVIDRIVAETGGNPLALAEVAGRWRAGGRLDAAHAVAGGQSAGGLVPAAGQGPPGKHPGAAPAGGRRAVRGTPLCCGAPPAI